MASWIVYRYSLCCWQQIGSEVCIAGNSCTGGEQGVIVAEKEGEEDSRLWMGDGSWIVESG